MSISRLIRSSAFVVSFGFFMLLVILFTLFFGTGESFTLFKAWTVNQNLKLGSNFVRVAEIDSPIVGTVLAQVKVGQGSFYGDTTWATSMRLRDQTQSLVEMDILQVLRDADDPKQVLELHIAQLEQASSDIFRARESLLDLAQQKREASGSCYTSKQAGDGMFFEGVNAGDPQKTQNGLDQSLEYGPCYITNRIEANAYAYMAERVAAYQTLIGRRAQVLSSNAQLLTAAYPLLHGNVAEQLVQLKGQLQTVNTTDFAAFSEYFSFGVPEVGTLPSLQNIRFRDNELNVPNYLNPVERLGTKDE